MTMTPDSAFPEIPSATSDPHSGLPRPAAGAYLALTLLLGLNLFNYIDRQILASVEPEIRKALLAPDDPNAKGKMGLLASAFLVSYMLAAPVFGALAGRWPRLRWSFIGAGVILWSLATGAGWLAMTFAMLLATRCFVGVGEGAYGPLAPAILSDYFPLASRGKVLACFYIALPVGGALGYALGDFIANIDSTAQSWRWAFALVAIPGLFLGLMAMLMHAPKQGMGGEFADLGRRLKLRDYGPLYRTPSFLFDTAGMTAMTFAIGALAFWMPAYLEEFRKAPEFLGMGPRTVFGVITAVAGLAGTVIGGWAGDALRKRLPSSYFWVSGVGLLVSAPSALLFLVTPFPAAWGLIFLSVFFMFVNTGPTNTILANVIHPALRPVAFAVNIFVIHILGDVISPTIIGAIADRANLAVGFVVVSVSLVAGGLLWIKGAQHLERDTEAAARQLA